MLNLTDECAAEATVGTPLESTNAVFFVGTNSTPKSGDSLSSNVFGGEAVENAPGGEEGGLAGVRRGPREDSDVGGSHESGEGEDGGVKEVRE